MRCTSPWTVGFRHDGKTLAWSYKQHSKEYPTFQLPCGKCLSCRLEYSRQTAIRCVHESLQYKDNSFITLTYSEENLKSNKLQYKDFQNFIKKLRSHILDEKLKKMYPTANTQDARREIYRKSEKATKDMVKTECTISVFCTGEYGDKKKRPHWHAIIFNWEPQDKTHKYTNDRGDKVYSSEILNILWPYGISEIGSVTFESASYVARYATKKLYHGKDGTHEYEPISRRSTKNAIGKTWIEKNWKDCFTNGYLVFKKKDQYIQCGIPRYYEKWLKKNHPTEWTRYVTQVKPKIIQQAEKQEEKTTLEEKKANFKRSAIKGLNMKPVKTKKQHEADILKSNFDKVRIYQKL